MKNFEGKYVELYNEDNLEINKLVDFYKKNKYTARVLFMNSRKERYHNFKVVLFEEKNGDFNIIIERKCYGINKNNKMYSNQKRVLNISYKNNKFHMMTNTENGTFVRQLTKRALNSTEIGYDYIKIVKNELQKRFTWLRFLFESEDFQTISFNTIIKNKLYSLTKVNKFVYKLPNNVIKKLNKNFIGFEWDERFKNLKFYSDYYYNIENFNYFKGEEFNLFYDTLKMSKTMDKKVNCSWSIKRLKLEHDKLSKNLTEIIYTIDNQKLDNSKIYLKFSEFSGYNIIKDTKELAYEGLRRKHCVVSYNQAINRHDCSIFTVDDYTLELRYNNKIKLYIAQFRGFDNCDAPDSLRNEVNNKLNKFNKNIKEYEEIIASETSVELPF